MKSVLISINPKWCELIANGKKTVEVRKTRPKTNLPFKVYIYCTNSKTIGDFILCKSEKNAKLFGYNTAKGINKGFAEAEDIPLKGKVIGEFVCDDVFPLWAGYNGNRGDTCLTFDETEDYLGGEMGYGWRISDLVIYDKPKDLGGVKVRVTNKIWSFTKKIERPPQSWCYVEGVRE